MTDILSTGAAIARAQARQILQSHVEKVQDTVWLLWWDDAPKHPRLLGILGNEARAERERAEILEVQPDRQVRIEQRVVHP